MIEIKDWLPTMQFSKWEENLFYVIDQYPETYPNCSLYGRIPESIIHEFISDGAIVYADLYDYPDSDDEHWLGCDSREDAMTCPCEAECWCHHSCLVIPWDAIRNALP